MTPPETPPRDAVAYPPETVEGWYALHQVYGVDRAALRRPELAAGSKVRRSMADALAEVATPDEGGWSAVVGLVGSRADMMLLHFRPTLDALEGAQRRLAREPMMGALRPAYSFLSITEAGLYHLTAEAARVAEARGGTFGDAAYRDELAPRVEAERASAHVQRRLFPPLPADMPYICFYPMSKRRDAGQNWYTLPLAERSRLMTAHGLTGRRYAGRVVQVITGAIGLDAWEWGVTLFARDPLEFKKLVTEMRFDEVSAKYAEFGEFFVGRLVAGAEWVDRL